MTEGCDHWNTRQSVYTRELDELLERLKKERLSYCTLLLLPSFFERESGPIEAGSMLTLMADLSNPAASGQIRAPIADAASRPSRQFTATQIRFGLRLFDNTRPRCRLAERGCEIVT